MRLDPDRAPSALDASRFVVAEFVLAMAVIACFTPPQNDTWWHLRAGQEMVRSGDVMLTDQFSHTANGLFWPNHEWLTQLVFYGVYSLGGLPLLTALCGLSCLSAWLLSFRLTRGQLEDRLLLVALGVPGVLTGWALRPQAFTFLLLMVVVLVTLRGRHWWLPFLFLVWANLHGAVALGLVVLVADLVVDFWWGQRRWVRKTAFLGFCVAATLVTPLGLGYWTEVGRILHRSRVNVIYEWTVPAFTPQFAFFWVLACAFVVLAVTRWRGLSERSDRVIVATAFLLLGLALGAMRNIGPFALVAIPALSRLLWPAAPEVLQAIESSRRAGVARTSLLLGSCALAVVVVVFRWFWMPPAVWTPVSSSAAAAIKACPERLFNHYNDGGYLIWFVPERKVFIDSRQDPYPAVLMKALDEAEVQQEYGPLFARHGIGCAVVRPGSAAARTLARGNVLRYQDRDWIVFDVAR